MFSLGLLLLASTTFLVLTRFYEGAWQRALYIASCIYLAAAMAVGATVSILEERVTDRIDQLEVEINDDP